jgi:hypothetical protein
VGYGSYEIPPLQSPGFDGSGRLILVDFPDDLVLGPETVAADGTASAESDAVQQGLIWRVERMTTVVTDVATGKLVTTIPTGALLIVSKVDGSGQDPTPVAWREGSQSPVFDIADEVHPITVRQGNRLRFDWSGLTVGTHATATVQYALLRRTYGT